jgi:hypothetical protein
MQFKRLVAAALPAVLLSACSSGSADQKTVAAVSPSGGNSVPVVSDLAPGYDLEGGKALDIKGIALGMTRGEARAALDALFPGNVKEFDSNFSGGEGSVVVMRDYVAWDEVPTPKGTGNSETMKAEYTNQLSGGRVISVRRSLEYVTGQPSVKETLQTLVAKYGPPTLTNDLSYQGMEYVYVWFDGKLVPAVSQADVDAFGKQQDWQNPPKNALWCLDHRVLQHVYSTTYSYEASGSSDVAPGCTAYLDVVATPGDSPDMLRRLEVTLVDHQRILDAAAISDKWLTEQIKKEQSAKGGGATPAM